MPRTKQHLEDRIWTEVTTTHLRTLYDDIEKYRGQLALALGVLLSLGFSLEDFTDLLP